MICAEPDICARLRNYVHALAGAPPQLLVSPLLAAVLFIIEGAQRQRGVRGRPARIFSDIE
jgi:hypothetical protein